MSESNETHYMILNIPVNASDVEIKKAYKLQSLKWHPDRVSEDKKAEATERFKRISEAYQVLSDKTRREEYDSNMSPPGGASASDVPLSADELFHQECGNLFKDVAAGIAAQRGEGEDRIAPTVGWTVAGGAAGYIAGAILFAPVAVPAALLLGAVGAIKGYTGEDMTTVVNTMDPHTKQRILNLMFKQNQQQ